MGALSSFPPAKLRPMRAEQTPSEQHAIETLKQVLAAEGRKVLDLNWPDRPDALLEIDGRRVAVECRTFTSERLLRLYGLDMPDGCTHQVYIPFEPHVWIAEATQSKASKVPEYLARTGAEACWLVLHAARGVFHRLVERYHYGAADFFRMGACQVPHDFERIYLTAEYADPPLPPVSLFSETDDIDDRARLQRMRVAEVPVERHWFGEAVAVEGPDGQAMVTLTLADPNQVRKFLQPLDRNLAVDYSQIEAVPAHQTWDRRDLDSLTSHPRGG